MKRIGKLHFGKSLVPPILFLFLALFVLIIFPINAQSNSVEKVLVFSMSGTITTATADAFADAVRIASLDNYEVVIILMSTPGGSLDAMLRIIASIDNSPVPVVSYVYPSGATSWSAGTYILVASHIAAMSPQSVIGSCQPISYSPFGSAPINDSKTINALVEVMKTHALARGRNATMAVSFIIDNTNLDDSSAYNNSIIEIRVSGLANLLNEIDGRVIHLANRNVTLKTSEAQIVDYEYRLRDQLLNVVSDPTVSSILFLVGIFSLIFGFSTPGHGGEILGGISIILALFGMGFDVNLLSIAMVILGAIFIMYELVTPGFGIFGIAGIILLLVGTLFLIPLTPEKWALSGDFYLKFTSIILAVGACIAAITLFIIYKIFQVRRKRPIIGIMIGNTVTAKEDAAPGIVGYVDYDGESWSAKCEKGMMAGKKYTITGKDGSVLILQELIQ